MSGCVFALLRYVQFTIILKRKCYLLFQHPNHTTLSLLAFKKTHFRVYQVCANGVISRDPSRDVTSASSRKFERDKNRILRRSCNERVYFSWRDVLYVIFFLLIHIYVYDNMWNLIIRDIWTVELRKRLLQSEMSLFFSWKCSNWKLLHVEAVHTHTITVSN